MKSINRLILLGIVILSITGCATNSSAPAQVSTDSTVNTGTVENTLPELSQLIVGPFKLEGTENAIQPDQAEELLFLWQGYKELSGRDSAADEEKAAILRQVNENMTTEQMDAIQTMNLTQQDIRAVVLEYGSNGTFREAASSNTTGGGFGGGMMGGGMMGGGVPPDGGGIPPDMATGSQSNNTTADTVRNSGSGMLINQLLDPLITLLETRASE